MSRRVILASQSQSRRAVLSAAGVDAEAMPSYLDEEGVKAAMRADKIPVRDQAMQLAELKAVKISQREDALVIGCDQMLSLDGIAFDKPHDLAEARKHLQRLSGKTHILETAIIICEGGAPVWRHMARPRLTMRPLSEGFIDSYIEAGGESLLSTVGAYQLEGLGAQLFTSIEGDYFSVLGLPLLPLLDYLRVRGVLPS